VTGSGAILIAYAALNAATWACYRIDKARAGQGARRISERTLLLLALAGGSLGALAGVYGHRRRHKANKWRFVALLWGIVALHAATLAFVIARHRGTSM
jgi:uncharacterized membrane protein YsdA (DUF1294 family)